MQQQEQEQEQTTPSYTYDRDARAMCDALARALRVSYVIVNHVYETRLFPRAEAFASLDDARDALVRALREYEYEAEACERALRAQRLAELRRQQKPAVAKELSLIHLSDPTTLRRNPAAVLVVKKKNQ